MAQDEESPHAQPDRPDGERQQPEVQPGATGEGGSTNPEPPPESIVSEGVLVSPKGKRYRVLRTNERDVYDQPDAKPDREG